MEKPTLTICAATGTVLTETLEGITMPADYSFATVNDYADADEAQRKSSGERRGFMRRLPLIDGLAGNEQEKRNV